MRPEGHSLDRIDPYGNYEPGNLRWADRRTQANNIRDPEGRSAKISAANRRRTYTPETREKISAANTGKVTAFNTESQKIETIATELYHSRKDIYFNPNSKVYKEWKSNR